MKLKHIAIAAILAGASPAFAASHANDWMKSPFGPDDQAGRFQVVGLAG